MSIRGRWRIVAMPGYVEDYPDMVEPAYILFETDGLGAFAFGCVTGRIFGAGEGDAVAFSWDGNDEMDEVQGDGRAEFQPDGSLKGTICFHGGDEVNFIAAPMDFFNSLLGVQSRGQVGGGAPEAFGLICPYFADGFIWCEAA